MPCGKSEQLHRLQVNICVSMFMWCVTCHVVNLSSSTDCTGEYSCRKFMWCVVCDVVNLSETCCSRVFSNSDRHARSIARTHTHTHTHTHAHTHTHGSSATTFNRDPRTGCKCCSRLFSIPTDMHSQPHTHIDHLQQHSTVTHTQGANAAADYLAYQQTCTVNRTHTHNDHLQQH